jgi:CII-binding regulator of phage lambda lysogenization HflD
MNDLTEQQAKQVMEGMNMILNAFNAPSLDEIMAQQEHIINMMPLEQREQFRKTIHENVINGIAASVKMSTDEYKRQLASYVKK